MRERERLILSLLKVNRWINIYHYLNIQKDI